MLNITRSANTLYKYRNTIRLKLNPVGIQTSYSTAIYSRLVLLMNLFDVMLNIAINLFNAENENTYYQSARRCVKYLSSYCY